MFQLKRKSPSGVMTHLTKAVSRVHEYLTYMRMNVWCREDLRKTFK